jgi:septum formation protein
MKRISRPGKLRHIQTAVLVSSSPRRRELLGRFVPVLVIMEPRTPEPPVAKRSDLQRNARAKLRSVEAPEADLVLAADTGIFLGGRALGKPRAATEARRMLRRLTGRRHIVVSAMALIIDGQFIEASVETEVTFRELGDDVIDAYVATGEPLDKAGGYGIQGLGGLLVKEIHGDYNNVVGLPLAELESLLEARGYTLVAR